MKRVTPKHSPTGVAHPDRRPLMAQSDPVARQLDFESCVPSAGDIHGRVGDSSAAPPTQDFFYLLCSRPTASGHTVVPVWPWGALQHHINIIVAIGSQAHCKCVVVFVENCERCWELMGRMEKSV